MSEEQLELKRPAAPGAHFDPNDQLSKEELDNCLERVDKELTETNFKELNLAKSEINVPGQEWVLVSFVGESMSQKTSQLGMKVWGTFPDISSAKAWADKINKTSENSEFDIFILEMYTWAVIPPDRNCMEDNNYQEDKLHDIITEHKKQNMIAKEIFDTRKEKLKNNPDINQFNKNKQILKELMNGKDDDAAESVVEGIQNEEAYKKVFGDTQQLPTLKVLGNEDTVLSESQKLSEDSEEYKKKIKELNEKVLPQINEEAAKLAAKDLEIENDYNNKFYNK